MSPLPTSRWREPADRRRPAGAANRVRDAQAGASAALRWCLVFAVAAAVAGTVDNPTGRWLPLHLLLAGAATLAVSGTTLFLAVTWSAAPAAPRRAVDAQRWLIGGGAAGIAASRALELPDAALAITGGAFAAGLAVLGALLVGTARQAVERRYLVPIAWYVVAAGCGVTGSLLGAATGTGSGGAGARPAHVALNLLGLVGLVVGGTLPSFVATVGRARLWTGATPARHAACLCWQGGALTLVVVGSLAEVAGLTALGLLAYAGGLLAVDALTPRFTRRQLTWAGPRLLGLHAAVLWWVGAVVAMAFRAADGGVPFTGRPVAVLAVAGLGQLLWGSLCYLLPVLRGGGHERLSAGFATTRSWTALVAVNVAGVALAAGLGIVAAVALAAFLAESATRFVLVVAR